MRAAKVQAERNPRHRHATPCARRAHKPGNPSGLAENLGECDQRKGECILYRHRLDAQDQCDLDDRLTIDAVPPEYFPL